MACGCALVLLMLAGGGLDSRIMNGYSHGWSYGVLLDIVLHGVIADYLKRSGIEVAPHLEIDNYAMAISLVASTRGVALLPKSVEDYLPASVVSRCLEGERPTVDLVIGYHKANASPILKMLVSKIDDLNSKAWRKVGG